MKLICEQLEFSYENKKLIHIENFEIQSQSHILIKGASGSGKSTFLLLLAGMIKPHRGKISWENKNISDIHESEILEWRKNNLNFLHQENKMIDHWTVLQNLQLFHFPMESMKSIFKELDLSEDLFDQKVETLSGGQRQLVNIALIFLKAPKYVLLDEPSSHLDDTHVEKMMKALQKYLSKSILIVVSHDMRLDQYFPQIKLFHEINQ